MLRWCRNLLTLVDTTLDGRVISLWTMHLNYLILTQSKLLCSLNMENVNMENGELEMESEVQKSSGHYYQRQLRWKRSVPHTQPHHENVALRERYICISFFSLGLLYTHQHMNLDPNWYFISIPIQQDNRFPSPCQGGLRSRPSQGVDDVMYILMT